MKNLREFGIKFRGYNLVAYGDTGIASIVVYNITTDKYIADDGTESDTLVERYFDTYCSANFSSVEKILMYWITLVDGDEYDITVGPSGTGNIAATAFDICVLGYYEKNAWIDGHVHNTLKFWHTDFPFDSYNYIPVSGEQLELLESQTLIADGFTDVFSLTTGRAYSFEGVSIGGTMLNPFDTSITWGSNETYDDEVIFTSTGRFSVAFLETPIINTEVIIYYRPLVNRYKIYKTFKLPEDALDSSIVATSSVLRELSWSCEII